MTLELGATRCLRKPFTPQALLAAVNDCLNKPKVNASSQRKTRSRQDLRRLLTRRLVLGTGLAILLVISGTSILLEQKWRTGRRRVRSHRQHAEETSPT